MRRPRFAMQIGGGRLEPWHVLCLDELGAVADFAGVLPAGPRSPLPDAPTLTPEQVEAGELDFILGVGRSPPAPGLAAAARHGVWRFAHEVAGDPLPFSREVYAGDDVTHAALLAFTSDSAPPAVLQQGWFRTEKRSYALQRERLLASLARWPALVCRRLGAGGAGEPSVAFDRAAAPPAGPRRPPPPVRFAARLAARRLAFAWARLLRHPQWNVGWVPMNAGDLLRAGAWRDDLVEWFPLRGRDAFLADPFGLALGGKLCVMCEQFDYRAGTGHIAALGRDGARWLPGREPAITLPVHMSYPCLIEDAGDIWCVPETGRAGEISLFRAVEFPRRWEKVATLVAGFAGVDPTVFRHEGRWWLTCTEQGREEDASLWVWHAPALAGPWTAHVLNPVKTDVRGARPGGAPFVHEGVLYRPTQDCSKRYGWRIVIQRVRSLTPAEFAEEPVAVIEAGARSPYPLGRHTFTPAGDGVLVDGHRAVFVGTAFRAFLRIWARDLTRRFRWSR